MDEIRQYAYKCKQCDTVSPISSRVCPKKRCGANLSVYGEYGLLDEYGNWSPVEHTPSIPAAPIEINFLEPEVPQDEQQIASQGTSQNSAAPPPPSINNKKDKHEPKPQKVKTERLKKSGGSRKKGIIAAIILILLLAAGIVGLIWYLKNQSSNDNDSPSEKKTSATTTSPSDADPSITEPTTQPDEPKPDEPAALYDIPDFESFANPYATFNKSEVSAQYHAIDCYYYAHECTSEVLLEYDTLLTDHYSFERYKTHKVEHGSITTYCLFYRSKIAPNARTLGLTFSDGTKSEQLHLAVRFMVEPNKTPLLQITFTDDFQFVNHNYVTAFKGNVLPDFAEWANNIVGDHEVQKDDGINYAISEIKNIVGWKDVFSEFCSFLDLQYDYQKIKTSQFTSDDGIVMHGCWLDYVGNANVPSFTAFGTTCDVFLVWYYNSNNQLIFSMCYPDEITLVSPVSYNPVS